MPNPPKDRAERLALGVLAAAVLLFVGSGLPHLFDPPIGTHAWRQAIATSMARLYAEGQPFLYPRAEGCGAEPGVFMGSEFPLYAWLLSALGGSPAAINGLGRALGLLFAVAWVVALFALARYLLRRWPEPARSAGAAAAGAFVAFSPLFRFYGIGFLPDVAAHALTLLGAALFAGLGAPRAERLSLPRFAAGAVLIGLGCLTKLIALPHLALAGLVLLDRARPRAAFSGFKSPRPWALGVAFVLLVFTPIALWYVKWVPVLKAGGCDLVWLPAEMDDNWRTATYLNPEWRSRVSDWGRNELLGPLWIACVAGFALLPTLGWRGLVLLVWTAGAAGSFVRLGWHSKQHDYDLLLLLPALAVGFGLAFGGVVWAAGRVGDRLKRRLPARVGVALPFVLLVAVLAAVAPYTQRRADRHFKASLDEVELEVALDKVLPEGEPLHYFGNRHDPRIPYYARRRALATEPPRYCQKKKVLYDCVLAPETGGRLSPCLERGPAVAWPGRSLVCGILRPQEPLVPPRVLAQIRASVRFPLERAAPGAGTLLGVDLSACGQQRSFVCAGDLPRRRFADVYVLAERAGPRFELRADGKPLQSRPAPDQWIPGAVIVVRAELPDGCSKLEVRLGDERIEIAPGG